MTEVDDPPVGRMDRALSFVAIGFGLGLLKPAPGTWGSLLGLPLTWALCQTSLPIAGAIWAVLFLVGVRACDAAARSLGRKDPGECVIDEYVAIPLVCAPLMIAGWPIGWTTLLLAFGLFRLFDIWKPWPIKRLEAIRGGWGVMVDDVAAAVYAAAVLGAIAIATKW